MELAPWVRAREPGEVWAAGWEEGGVWAQEGVSGPFLREPRHRFNKARIKPV